MACRSWRSVGVSLDVKPAVCESEPRSTSEIVHVESRSMPDSSATTAVMTLVIEAMDISWSAFLLQRTLPALSTTMAH